MSRLATSVLLALTAACATPPPPPPDPAPIARPAPPPPPLAPLPAAPQVIATRLDPDTVFDRVRQRLYRKGFSFDAPIRADAGIDGRRVVARSSRILTRTPDAEPLCAGDAEVIQASIVATATGSIVRVGCYTARLDGMAAGEVTCRQEPETGCAAGGDRLVAELALDVISFF